MHMPDISVLVDLPVFTKKGTFVGHIKNAILDMENRRIDGLVLTRTNPELVERGLDVAIPYRWISEWDRIVVLNHFPQKVSAPAAAPPEPEDTPEIVQVNAA